MTLSRRIDSIVAHQLSCWEGAARRIEPGRCVAIANLPGAGGEEVGRRGAAALGYGCFAREIVDEIARARGVGQELLRGVDERVRSAIDRYLTDSFHERRFTESDYLKEVARLVTTLAQRGMAVIVGRGAAFIVAPGAALRVLVSAPFEFRLGRFALEHELPRETAAPRLRDEDARRFEFVRHHFDVRLDDPLAYDLTVNTETLGLDAAAAGVVDAFRRRFAA
jgi:cytidylate kinase